MQALKVLLADEDEGALRVTAALVRELGHEVAEMAIGVQEAAEVIARDDPDVSLVVVYQDDGHALDLIEEISEFARGPVIAIVEKEDPEFVSRGGQARHLRLRARGAGGVDPVGDRGRDAPPRRRSASWSSRSSASSPPSSAGR